MPSNEIQSPSFTTIVFLADRDRELLAVLVDLQRSRAHDARPAHAARHHRRVAGFAADRGQNALRNVHAVNVVGRGFFAHQDRPDRSSTASTASSAVNAARPTAAPGDAGNARCNLGQRLERRRIEHRMQAVDRAGSAPRAAPLPSSLIMPSSTISTATRTAAVPGAFAVAGLQHVERAVFDGELEILHVAVMLFEARW